MQWSSHHTSVDQIGAWELEKLGEQPLEWLVGKHFFLLFENGDFRVVWRKALLNPSYILWAN